MVFLFPLIIQGNPSFNSETKATLTYYFTWPTQYACPLGSTGSTGTGNTTGGSSGGLSGGSVFLIM